MFKFIREKINRVDKKTKILFGLFAFILILVMKGNVGNVGSSDELKLYFSEKREIHILGKTLHTDRVLSQYVGMLSIAEYGMINIPEELIVYSRRDIGFTKDMRVFSWFPIGLQVMSIPFYWVGKTINMSLLFAHLSIVLISFFNLILLYQISLKIFRLPKKIGYLVSYIYGFASVALVYSVVYIPHQISTFLLLLCFYLAWSFFNTYSTKKKWIFMSLIWLLWSTSSFFDYPNWIIISPVFIYIFFKILTKSDKKKNFIILFVTSIFGISGLFGQGMYNHFVYDNWQQMSNTLPQYTWWNPEKILEDYLNIGDVIEEKNNILNILNISSIKKGLYTLLFSLDRGLFIFSPMFVLSLLGYFYFLKKIKHEKIFLLYAPIFTILIYSMFGDPWGGWAFGARYLLPVMAMLALSLGLLHERIKNIYFRGLMYILIVFSAIQSVAGVMSTTALKPGDNTMVYGIKNYHLLMNNVSGNFWYEILFEGYIPVISWFVLVLMFVIAGLLIILKD